MTTLLTIPPGSTYYVIDDQTINLGFGTDGTPYGTNYVLQNGQVIINGIPTTLASLIAAAGGATYAPGELKSCVLVQGYDLNSNGKVIFTLYSNNSQSVGKNDSSQIPGGAWVTTFDFLPADVNTGPMQIWVTALGGQANFLADSGIVYSPTWLGFQIDYGTMQENSYVLTQLNNFNEESVPGMPVNIDVTLMHGALVSGIFVIPQAPELGVVSDDYVPIYEFKLYRAAASTDGEFVYERVPAPTLSVPNPSTFNPNVAVPAVGDAVTNRGYGPVGEPFPGTAYYYAGAVPNTPNFGASINLPYAWEIYDNYTDSQLLEPLPSLNWDAPPAQGLQGLTEWKNGIMAAYLGNVVYFCEPYRPFTFPQIYLQPLPSNVIGMRVDDAELVVITDKLPYLFEGSHPLNVTYRPIQGGQAGIDPITISTPKSPAQGRMAPGQSINPTRAMVRTPYGVFYASIEGLVRVINGTATVWGRDLWTRDEWLLRYGPNLKYMRLSYYNGMLLGYFDNQATVGFIVNITGADKQLVEYTPVGNQVADFIIAQKDALYVVTYAGGQSTVSRFADENTPTLGCTYWTATGTVNPVNMAFIGMAGNGTVNCQVYADGNLVTWAANPTGLITFNLPSVVAQMNQTDIPLLQLQRLPSGFKAKRWSVSIQPTAGAAVSIVALSETGEEMAEVEG